MSQEENNGAVPPPRAPGMKAEEEFGRWVKKVEAEWPSEPDGDDLQRTADLCWAENDPDLERLYADKYVAVHQKRILAVGDEAEAVYTEAEKVSGLPRGKIALAVILGPGAYL